MPGRKWTGEEKANIVLKYRPQVLLLLKYAEGTMVSKDFGAMSRHGYIIIEVYRNHTLIFS